MRHREFGILIFALLLGMVSLHCEGAVVRKAKTHEDGIASVTPTIKAVYVAYRTVNTGANNMAFPYYSNSVLLRAVVLASVNGEDRAYTDLSGCPSEWESGSAWHVSGLQGPACPYNPDTQPWPDYKYLSSIGPAFATLHQWQTDKWGTPCFTWRKCKHVGIQKGPDRCEQEPNVRAYHRTFGYEYEVPAWSAWGTSVSGVHLPIGLARYEVDVTLNNRTVKSPAEEVATRIAVRSNEDFYIVIPPEGEPGHAEASMRMQYLRWIFCYRGEPYEFGGHWFGGTSSPQQLVGGCSGYDLLGIDCSGLVSCAARWTGYGWHRAAGSWRRSTWSFHNQDVTTLLANQEDIRPGDILNVYTSSDKHVRTVYYVYTVNGRRKVNIIAAEGGSPPESGLVCTMTGLDLLEQFSAGYKAYALNAYPD